MTGERNTTVCFSGHRRYASAPDDEARLASTVEAACDDGYRVFVSGMAPGFDLAAAEAVVRLREKRGNAGTGGEVRLVAAVPFRGQPRGYSGADLARYEALLAAADEVRVLSERYSPGCYYRRDEWMVDRSGRIVCWYDGGRGDGDGRGRGDCGVGGMRHAPSRSSGTRSKANSGTRYTVRCAVRAGLEVVNLFRDPEGTLF